MADTQNSVKIWQKISKTTILSLIFLLPLFFLPFASNVLDFNKQALLVVFVLVSFFAWLLKSLIEEKINLDTSKFNLIPAIFLVVTILSTLFSSYKYGSFWGWPLVVAPSLLTVLALIILYFLILHLFRKPEEIFGLIFVLMISGLIVSLFSLFQVFGKFALPFDFAKLNSFNTIGSTNSLAIFMAIILPLAAILVFISKNRWLKSLISLFLGLSLILLLAINFQTAWLVLLISSSIILIFGISRREMFNLRWLFLPMLFLAVALFALVIKTSVFPIVTLPAEISPSFSASLKIAWETMKESNSPFSWLFGSGPGTFVYDYSKYKPLDINQTEFWATRFSSSPSELIDKLATTGIFGFLSFLAVIIASILVGFRAVMSKEEKKDSLVWMMTIGVLSSLIGSVIGLLFYPGNVSLMFLFWLLVALIFSLSGSKSKTFNLQAVSGLAEGKSKTGTSLMTMGVSSTFIAVLIVSMFIFFIQGQRFFAEANYMKALASVQKSDNDTAIKYLNTAIRLTDEKQDNYWRDLSQVYLFRINEELQKKDLTQEKMSQNVSNFISLLVGAAKSSTDSSPKNVANWTIRGYVYRNIIPLITSSDEWAVKSYEEAIKLDPKNPSIYTDFGQIYTTRADSLEKETEKASEKQEALNLAKINFQKALDLKSDYAPARFQLAMIDIRENKIKDAIVKLEQTKEIAPFDAGLGFQLGLIYQMDKQIDKAQAEFERVIVLDPNYVNAKYFLGLIYDDKGQKEKALEQFEKIAQLNPDNDLIKNILVNLKADKPALEGLTQPQPPIKETPEEQLKPGAEKPAETKTPSPSPTPKK